MANRRRIRTRVPSWKRGKRRPTRWNATASSGAAEGGAGVDFIQLPYGVGPQLPVLTLVSGQIDVEPWADDQEVTLDRVVGDITVRAWGTQDTADRLLSPVPMFKLALLVNEEVTQDVSGQTLDLWDQEQMEDYEWMWMHHEIPTYQVGRALTSPAGQIAHEWHAQVHLDLKNRRKIGQSDELNLYGSYRTWDGNGGANISYVEIAVDVREILMSR